VEKRDRHKTEETGKKERNGSLFETDAADGMGSTLETMTKTGDETIMMNHPPLINVEGLRHDCNSSVAALRLYSHHRNAYSHRAGIHHSHHRNTHTEKRLVRLE
jgi:hypothetical protein